MNDHVAVVNAALVKLGEKPITSMDDQVKAAELAKLRYDSIRQSALTLHTWHFAKDRLALTPLSSTPVFGFAYQFERPSQCLRILSTGGVPEVGGISHLVRHQRPLSGVHEGHHNHRTGPFTSLRSSWLCWPRSWPGRSHNLTLKSDANSSSIRRSVRSIWCDGRWTDSNRFRLFFDARQPISGFLSRITKWQVPFQSPQCPGWQ